LSSATGEFPFFFLAEYRNRPVGGGRFRTLSFIDTELRGPQPAPRARDRQGFADRRGVIGPLTPFPPRTGFGAQAFKRPPAKDLIYNEAPAGRDRAQGTKILSAGFARLGPTVRPRGERGTENPSKPDEVVPRPSAHDGFRAAAGRTPAQRESAYASAIRTVACSRMRGGLHGTNW